VHRSSSSPHDIHASTKKGEKKRVQIEEQRIMRPEDGVIPGSEIKRPRQASIGRSHARLSLGRERAERVKGEPKGESEIERAFRRHLLVRNVARKEKTAFERVEGVQGASMKEKKTKRKNNKRKNKRKRKVWKK